MKRDEATYDLAMRVFATEPPEPAGAQRERATRCQTCGEKTWHWSARCGFCLAETPDPHDHARDEMLAERYDAR